MLNIGETVTLEPINNVDGEKYRCRVVEKKGEKLYIDYPINEQTGRTVFLIDGTQLRASFVGKDNTVYLFETVVVGRYKQTIPMIILTYPGKDGLVRIQRRQYVRIDTAIDVAVHPTNKEFNPFVTVTSDISAGGALLILPNNSRVKPGLHIHTWFVLPLLSGEYGYLKLTSKVIRIVPGENGERDKASLELIEVKENERQLLIKFCFERQLLSRKKGLPSS
ncbi:flagellar brake domain-containing protein [Cytobacillus suaedae]|nr:flagellar brake domain-containing protein [Cytobacillus suaedae]